MIKFVVAFGVALILQGAKPVRLAAGAFLLCVRVVAGCAPCRVTQLTLGVTLQRSAAPPFPSGPCVPPGAPYQNTLGAVPQDPLTLKLRLDTNDAKHRPYSAADTLSRCLRRILFGGSRDQIKITPYKCRLIPLRECAAFPGGANGAPARSQDLVGRGGCTVAGRAARSKA